MYSNSTSLILTDLTRGENYSFAVAVTDSTGQYGPWSEELRVTWDGEYTRLHVYDHYAQLYRDRIDIKVYAIYIVPQAIVDYTTFFINGICCANWKVLYYSTKYTKQ